MYVLTTQYSNRDSPSPWLAYGDSKILSHNAIFMHIAYTPHHIQMHANLSNSQLKIIEGKLFVPDIVQCGREFLQKLFLQVKRCKTYMAITCATYVTTGCNSVPLYNYLHVTTYQLNTCFGDPSQQLDCAWYCWKHTVDHIQITH